MGSARIRLQKKHIFMAMFVLIYITRAYTDAVFVSRSEDSILTSVKYVLLFMTVIYGFALLKNNRKWESTYIIKNVVIVVVTAVTISTFRMMYKGIFSTQVFTFSFRILFPAILAIVVVNVCSEEDIYNCLSVVLYCCFFIYVFLEIGLSEFSVESFQSISFNNSYSPFESHYTSGTAMALFAFFSFYRKNKFNTVISLVFCLLCFKRVMLLASIVLFVIPFFVEVKSRGPVWLPYCGASVFIVLTIAYFWCLIPSNHHFLQNLLNIESVEKLTMTRSIFFEQIYGNPLFLNFGWGSCESYLGHSIEMELIQMYIELSVVGLCVFAFSYWDIAGNTIYGFIYMLYNFFNMLASHTLSNGFIWAIVFVTFSCIETTVDGKRIRRKYFRIKL